MIQPQELRIGNYVYDRGEKVIRIDFFEHLENGYDCKFGQNGEPLPDGAPAHPLTEYTDYAEPIPLTEEWLVKLGFVEIYSSDFRRRFELTQSPCFEYSFAFNQETTGDAIYYGRYLKCECVHQLQNIYHALTGKEMEVKP